MSALNNEQVLSANKAAIDTLLSVANTALATAESLAALNLVRPAKPCKTAPRMYKLLWVLRPLKTLLP